MKFKIKLVIDDKPYITSAIISPEGEIIVTDNDLNITYSTLVMLLKQSEHQVKMKE